MTERTTADRPYSPGLEGVIAGETSLSFIDGEQGRLLYRGYRIADLVRRAEAGDEEAGTSGVRRIRHLREGDDG